ncbi:hypothetical protein ACLKA6_005707 [Drosophila palustris]
MEEERNNESSIQKRRGLGHAGVWNLAPGVLKQEEAQEDFDWIGKDSKALAKITLSVKASQLVYIKNCTTSF